MMSRQEEAKEAPQETTETVALKRILSRTEAPHLRGLRALAARASGRLNKPGFRVWAAPLGRACGMAGVLSCVAFLGVQSKADEAYGPIIPVALPDVPAAQEGEEPSTEEHSHASGEAEPFAHTDSGSPSPCVKPGEAAPAGTTADGRVILNEATAGEFTKLSGVGEARAAAIVKLRERLGKFKKISDLLRVKGIGWKSLQKLKEQVVLDRPQEEPPAAEEKNSEPAASAGKSST